MGTTPDALDTTGIRIDLASIAGQMLTALESLPAWRARNQLLARQATGNELTVVDWESLRRAIEADLDRMAPYWRAMLLIEDAVRVIDGRPSSAEAASDSPTIEVTNASTAAGAAATVETSSQALLTIRATAEAQLAPRPSLAAAEAIVRDDPSMPMPESLPEAARIDSTPQQTPSGQAPQDRDWIDLDGQAPTALVALASRTSNEACDSVEPIAAAEVPEVTPDQRNSPDDDGEAAASDETVADPEALRRIRSIAAVDRDVIEVDRKSSRFAGAVAWAPRPGDRLPPAGMAARSILRSDAPAELAGFDVQTPDEAMPDPQDSVQEAATDNVEAIQTQPDGQRTQSHSTVTDHPAPTGAAARVAAVEAELEQLMEGRASFNVDDDLDLSQTSSVGTARTVPPPLPPRTDPSWLQTGLVGTPVAKSEPDAAPDGAPGESQVDGDPLGDEAEVTITLLPEPQAARESFDGSAPKLAAQARVPVTTTDMDDEPPGREPLTDLQAPPLPERRDRRMAATVRRR